MSYSTFLVLTMAASLIALFLGDALSRPVAAFLIGYSIAQLLSITTP